MLSSFSSSVNCLLNNLLLIFLWCCLFFQLMKQASKIPYSNSLSDICLYGNTWKQKHLAILEPYKHHWLTYIYFVLLSTQEQLVTSYDLIWKNHNSTLSQGLSRDLHTDLYPSLLSQHPHCSATSSLVIETSCFSSQDSNLCLSAQNALFDSTSPHHK